MNGEVRQDDTSDRMIFQMPYLIHYISTFCTLEPGDVILTGTPSGAGARFDPPRYLEAGRRGGSGDFPRRAAAQQGGGR